MPPARAAQLVALRLPHGPELARAVDLVWRGGDAVLPLDPALPPPAVDALLAELRPSLVVEAQGRRRLGGSLPVDTDVAAVLATSGSSGRPKGVELTHAALEHAARAGNERLGLGPGDRWLGCLPMHHVAGFQILVRARLLATAPDLHPRFDPRLVAASDATAVSLVPTMLARLLDAGVDLRRFRVVLLGGSSIPPALLERALHTGARIVTSYGMTETAGGCVYDGIPLHGVSVAFDPDGTILLRGPMLLHGYRCRDDLTSVALAGGWLHTADRGRRTPDGRIEILGRLDAVIVTGGVNVDPEEVEPLLRAHPDILDAAVAGRDDPTWGQRVVAYCVARDPQHPPSLDAVRRFVARRAAPSRSPRELVLVDEIPRTALGKVDRAALAAAARTTSGKPPAGSRASRRR